MDARQDICSNLAGGKVKVNIRRPIRRGKFFWQREMTTNGAGAATFGRAEDPAPGERPGRRKDHKV